MVSSRALVSSKISCSGCCPVGRVEVGDEAGGAELDGACPELEAGAELDEAGPVLDAGVVPELDEAGAELDEADAGPELEAEAELDEAGASSSADSSPGGGSGSCS